MTQNCPFIKPGLSWGSSMVRSYSTHTAMHAFFGQLFVNLLLFYIQIKGKTFWAGSVSYRVFNYYVQLGNGQTIQIWKDPWITTE